MDGNSAFGVGKRLTRREDARHLRGRGRFTGDLAPPGALHVAFVRSGVAHGHLKGVIKPPGAEDRVFTAADFPTLKPIRAVPDVPGFKASVYPALATGKVRFVGECVAMCVGATRGEAEDLAQQVELEIEPLDAVVDAEAAQRPGAPLIHEHWGDNLFIEKDFEGGDIAAAKARAAVTVTRRYAMHRQVGAPMEGRAALAEWDDRLDELVLWCSTQFPHQIRAALAEFLDVPEHRLHVIAPDVGGGFGVKNVLSPEELAVAALGWKLRRPVCWEEDRREHLLAAIHCRQHDYEVTAYADEAGIILGLDVKLTVDAGAYSTWPNACFMETGMAAKNVPGPYRIRNYRCRTFTVATNKSPIGPYRGVARPGACFAIERTIDEVARAVGREPHELRMANMIPPADMPYRSVTGLLYDNGDYARAVAETAELIGHDAVRKRQKTGQGGARLVGIGYASYTEQTAHGCGEWATRGTPVIPGFESATARLMPDGTLLLLVGIQSHGQGLETTLAQVASHELGIAPEHIAVRHGDSSLSPFGMGTFASRSMVMAGGAVAKVCRALRDKMGVVAAHLMQCEPDRVAFRDGRAFGPGEASVTMGDIGRAAHLRQDTLPAGCDPNMEITGVYEPGIATGVFCYSTHAAVIEVDTETGAVEVLDYAVVEDCGTMVNPMIVDGQIAGGVAQGIGTALYEEVIYDEWGQPQVTNLGEYVMPGPFDVPRIRIGHMSTPSPHTEYGMKGMGEGGAISPPAAIANAVRDALAGIGAELNETPITPARVLAAIAEAGR
jgi:carbon-monoxide dehydrogenase large subunit